MQQEPDKAPPTGLALLLSAATDYLSNASESSAALPLYRQRNRALRSEKLCSSDRQIRPHSPSPPQPLRTAPSHGIVTARSFSVRWRPYDRGTITKKYSGGNSSSDSKTSTDEICSSPMMDGEVLAASPLAGDVNDPILNGSEATDSTTQHHLNPAPSLKSLDSSSASRDIGDLAAFAAWVTLKLVGRRYSILMNSGIVPSKSSALNSFSASDAMVHHSTEFSSVYEQYSKKIPQNSQFAQSYSINSNIERERSIPQIMSGKFSAQHSTQNSLCLPPILNPPEYRSDASYNLPSLQLSASIGSMGSVQSYAGSDVGSLPPLSKVLNHILPPNHSVGERLLNIPLPPTTPPNSSLPPAYISHYTARLTRLASFTLLRLPTPPHTVVLALHLIRRLASSPRNIPACVATPTRMMLACLVIADAAVGSERGVPMRAWAAVARSSGINGSEADSGSGGLAQDTSKQVNAEPKGVDANGASVGTRGEDPLCRLLVMMKREVLETLDYELHDSLVGYQSWVRTLLDLLGNSESGIVVGASQNSASGTRGRTRRILEDLCVGEGGLGMGWKW